MVTPIKMELSVSTTSLKLPEALKERVAATVERLGVSAHAFMVQAIEERTAAAEQRAEFLAEAEQARAALLASGQGYDADTVHRYLRDKLEGRVAARPTPRAWRD